MSHRHADDRQCDVCKMGLTDPAHIRKHMLTVAQEDIRNYGWGVIAVAAGADVPSFAYTVGLWHGWQHPEIITFGLPIETAHILLNSVGDRVRDGHKFAHGETDSELANMPALFLQVPPDSMRSRATLAIAYAKEHGEPFPECLQLVWPDTHGKFYHEEGYDKRFDRAQPIIGAQYSVRTYS